MWKVHEVAIAIHLPPTMTRRFCPLIVAIAFYGVVSQLYDSTCQKQGFNASYDIGPDERV